MNKILAEVSGFGKWKRGKGEADLRRSCASRVGNVKDIKITPWKDSVEFILDVVFSISTSVCSMSEEGIAQWRIQKDILPEVFSEYRIEVQSYKKL